MLIRWRTREKVKRGGGQRVLVGAPIGVCTHQLFGRGVGHRSHRRISGGKTADVGQLAGYPEVRQQDSSFTVFWLGEQDVGGLYIAMQKTPLVGIVECPTSGSGTRRPGGRSPIYLRAPWPPCRLPTDAGSVNNRLPRRHNFPPPKLNGAADATPTQCPSQTRRVLDYSRQLHLRRGTIER
jgi:hypothetical protein